MHLNCLPVLFGTKSQQEHPCMHWFMSSAKKHLNRTCKESWYTIWRRKWECRAKCHDDSWDKYSVSSHYVYTTGSNKNFVSIQGNEKQSNEIQTLTYKGILDVTFIGLSLCGFRSNTRKWKSHNFFRQSSDNQDSHTNEDTCRQKGIRIRWLLWRLQREWKASAAREAVLTEFKLGVKDGEERRTWGTESKDTE